MAKGDKHHIDELLRANLSAPTSDYKPDWDAFAQKLAIAQKRKKSIRIGIVLSAAALLLVIGIFGVNIFSPTDSIEIEQPTPIGNSTNSIQKETNSTSTETTPFNTNDEVNDFVIEDEPIDANEIDNASEEKINTISEQDLQNKIQNTNSSQDQPHSVEVTIADESVAKAREAKDKKIEEVSTTDEPILDDIKTTNSVSETINTGIKEPTNNNTTSNGQGLIQKDSTNSTRDNLENDLKNKSSNNLNNTTESTNDTSFTNIPDSVGFALQTNDTNTIDQLVKPEEKTKIKYAPTSTKWIFSLNVYSKYTIRDVKINDDGKVHKDFEDILLSSEKAGFSTNIGFEVRYRPLPYLTLGSGIHYTQNRTVGRFDFRNSEVPVIDTNGTIVGYITLDSSQVRTVNQKIDNRLNYIEIPFLLTYEKQLSDKWYFNSELGVSVLFFLNTKGETVNSFSLETVNLSSQPTTNTLGSLHARLGVLYNFSGNWFVGVEPTYKHYLGTVFSSDSPVEIRQYTIGLNMSIQYRIK